MIKEVKGAHGTRYMKNGKFISKSNLTDEELNQLVESLKGPAKICLFCGTPAKLTRFVNMQVVYLCDEHYETKNVGKIAQKLSEVSQSSK